MNLLFSQQMCCFRKIPATHWLLAHKSGHKKDATHSAANCSPVSSLLHLAYQGCWPMKLIYFTPRGANHYLSARNCRLTPGKELQAEWLQNWNHLKSERIRICSELQKATDISGSALLTYLPETQCSVMQVANRATGWVAPVQPQHIGGWRHQFNILVPIRLFWTGRLVAFLCSVCQRTPLPKLLVVLDPFCLF